MFRTILLFTFTLLLLPGCGKKTEVQRQEEERQKLREEKRKLAVEAYKELSTKFPEHEKAKSAADKAKALEAAKK